MNLNQSMPDITEVINRKLSWEKFVLPEITFTSDEEIDEDEDVAPWLKKEAEENPFHLINQTGRILSTPLGLISPSSKESYHKSYNMWTAHTNFLLTEKDFLALNEVPGVEGLQPISNYRFNVVFGYCFNEDEVKKRIETQLICSLADVVTAYRLRAELINPELPAGTKKKLEAAVSLMEQPFYAIFIYPNEKMEIIPGMIQPDSNFCVQLQDFQVLQALVGGFLYVNDPNKTTKIPTP